MNKEQELKRQLKVLRENKGNLGENARVTSYRYLEGKLKGYQEAKKEFNHKLEQLKKDIDLEANDIISRNKTDTKPIFDLSSRINYKIEKMKEK